MHKYFFSSRILVLMVLVLSIAFPSEASVARIKDVAKIQGVRSNQLVGYGLVVGLAGTGDSNKSTYTLQSVTNMLRNFGITVDPSQIKPKNVAAVMITAQLPPFMKPGDTLDITVSAMGDAKSLQGGMLLQAPLKAADGQVYAVGQGALSMGGFAVSNSGSSQQKNFPTVAVIPQGAIVERGVAVNLTNDGTISLALHQPDFTTANRIAEVISRRFGRIASAKDAGTVTIFLPLDYTGNVVGFIAEVESLPVQTDSIARVVFNERTGTVVMGASVTINEVAVAQGGLSVKISSTRDVSQPLPFSAGETVTAQQTKIEVKESKAEIVILPDSAKVSDVVAALNAIGATPRDIISILQAIKAAGALNAELQIM